MFQVCFCLSSMCFTLATSIIPPCELRLEIKAVLFVFHLQTPNIFYTLLSLCWMFLCPISSCLSFVRKQLQDFLTSMTSSERCSIRRGCQRDQAGTSLSSLVHKGRMGCNTTSAATEKHLLQCALNGCGP